MKRELRIPGFDYRRLEVNEASYLVAMGGEGPPVLLLHGYPQTHYCWHRVAPELVRSHAVIAIDLRGYGASRAPRGGPLGEGYSKREMAADAVSLLDALGIERPAVVGHDRGGRVAYRMALDHPERVERLAVLNVVPTVEQFDRVTPANAIDYWPWFFLAQPPPFPERLIAAAPQHYLRSVIAAWAAWPERIGTEAMAHYVEAFDEATIAATCADYRASFHIDRPLDAADRTAGRQIGCPLLVVWASWTRASSVRTSRPQRVRQKDLWTCGAAGPIASKGEGSRRATSSPRRHPPTCSMPSPRSSPRGSDPPGKSRRGYSYASDSSTSSRDARRAGPIAASTPASAASTSRISRDPIGNESEKPSSASGREIRTEKTIPRIEPRIAPISAVITAS